MFGIEVGEIVGDHAVAFHRRVEAAGASTLVQNIPDGDAFRREGSQAFLVSAGPIAFEEVFHDAPERISWISVVLTCSQRHCAGHVPEDQQPWIAAGNRRQSSE